MALHFPESVYAAPIPGPKNFVERFSSNTTGDIFLIGNTGMTCQAAAAGCATAQSAAPIATGTNNAINNNNFNGTMTYIDLDGDATTWQSTNAALSMPAGSTVLWAGLYWGGEFGDGSANPAPLGPRAPRDTIKFRTPASGYVNLTASEDYYIANQGCGTSCDRYTAFADVTALVRAAGNGTYWMANLRSTNLTASGSAYGGWGLVIAFENSSLPLRNLSVFDGYQQVGCGSGNIDIPVSGFLTPLSGPVTTVMGVIAGEGDAGSVNDVIRLNGLGLVDPLHPAANSFGAVITDLGSYVHTKNPDYNNQLGWDVFRMNASNILANAATGATMNLTTTGDCYYPSTATFTTDLYVPVVTPNVVKTGLDVNGGNLVPNDVLRYSISMFNSGYDSASNLSLADKIPPYTSYVPGSLFIISGPTGAPLGVMSDSSGDDAAEYVVGSGDPTDPVNPPQVNFRLGAGANATSGGTLKYTESTSLRFDVKLDDTIPAGTILTNRAELSYNGQTLGTVYAAASSAAASAVFVPPGVTKTFTPPVVANSTGTTTLRLVFTNPATNLGALLGVAVTDTYPAGLVNISPDPNPSLTCTPGSTPGTITGGVAGGNSIGMTGTTIAQNGSCTLSVTVSGTGDGIYINNVGQVTTTNGGNSPTPSATATFSVGVPTITKTFAAASIARGTNTTLTFTLSNPTASLLTGASFTDSYPAGLVNATPPNIRGSCANRAVDAATVAGSGVFNLTAADIPASGSCTVIVDVNGTTEGSKDNSTSGVTTNQTNTSGAPSNTANLLVYAPLTATKAFFAPSISTNGTSQLTIVVSNPNPAEMGPVTGISFTDTYPANLDNSGTPNASFSCTPGSSMTLTGGVAGADTIGMNSGSIASGGSCTIRVNVTSAAAASYNDNADAIATTNAGNGATVSAATLVVSGSVPPTVTKGFVTPVAPGATSLMTITLNNGTGSAMSLATLAANGTYAMVDYYPSGLVNATIPAATTTCVGGSAIASAGGDSLILNGGTIPANGSCTVTVNVTSSTPDVYYNNTGLLYTTNAGIGLGASGNVSFLSPPTIAKSFGPNPVAPSGTTSVVITLGNPGTNPISLTGIGFTDTYPAGMTNNATAATNGCGGTVTAADGTNTLVASGITIASGATCTITKQVIAPATGPVVNTTGAVTSTEAGTGSTATATLAVGAPGITKAFASSPILATTGTSVLTITLSNPTGAAMTGAAFTDTYPAGMTNTTTAATTCALGTATAAANGNTVSLSGATIPANGSCTVTVTVKSTVTGTNTIPAGGLTVNDGASNANPATATLVVTPPPVATKSFAPASITTSAAYTVGDIALGEASWLTIVIANPTSNTINGVTFTDTYPTTNIKNGTAPNVTATAGSTCNVTGGVDGSTVGLANTSILLGNGSCTITVPVYVTAVTGSPFTNTTGNITTTNGGTGQPATAVLTVLTLFTGTKSFSPATVSPAPDNSNLTITLTNPNAGAAVTGVNFTDTYPANLINSTPLTISTTCGGAISGGTGNPGTLSLSGGTIPAGGNCTVTAVVESTTAGNKTNPTFTVSSTNDGTATVAAATLNLVALVAPGVTKSFSPAQVTTGANSTLTITLSNSNGVRMDGIAFTDTYPAGMVNTSVAADTCANANAVAVIGGNTVSINNARIVANSSCTITVNVKSDTAGTYNNSTGLVTSTNAATGGPASDTLNVTLAAPTVTKSFTPGTITAGTPSTMNITITNPNTAMLTGVSFTDSYPAGLINTAIPGVINTCGGTVTAMTGDTSLVLTGGTVPASGNCSVEVQVTSSNGGSLTNSTGIIYSGNAQNGGPAEDVLNILALPNITLLKSALVYSDPVNNTSNPKAIPGAEMRYTLQSTNFGAGTADSLAFTDAIPVNSTFYGGDLGQGKPVFFTNGPVSSGFTAASVIDTYSSKTDCSNFSYTPTNGYDSNVCALKIQMTGAFNGASGGNNPSFSLMFQVKID